MAHCKGFSTLIPQPDRHLEIWVTASGTAGELKPRDVQWSNIDPVSQLEGSHYAAQCSPALGAKDFYQLYLQCLAKALEKVLISPLNNMTSWHLAAFDHYNMSPDSRAAAHFSFLGCCKVAVYSTGTQAVNTYNCCSCSAADGATGAWRLLAWDSGSSEWRQSLSPDRLYRMHLDDGQSPTNMWIKLMEENRGLRFLESRIQQVLKLYNENIPSQSGVWGLGTTHCLPQFQWT